MMALRACELAIIGKYCKGLGIDVGCHKRRIGNAIGVDIDDDATAATVRGDASALPFYSGTLDYVLGRHCLEHVRDAPLFVLHEWLRVLRANGTLVILVPDGECGTKSLDYASLSGEVINGGHGHLFTLDTLKALVWFAGGNIELAKHYDCLPDNTKQTLAVVARKDASRFTEYAAKHSMLLMKYRSAQIVPPETRWQMWLRRICRACWHLAKNIRKGS